MKFSDYMDSVENTEQEDLLRQKLQDVKEFMEKIPNIPIIGKMLKALVAYGDSDGIEEFRQSAHYDNIKDWNISVPEIEKGNVSIQPGFAQWLKIINFIIIVCVCVSIYKRIKKKRAQ